MILRMRLKEILAERGITQKKLSEDTGLREGTISEMANNLRDSINRRHISTVAEYLGITNVEEILEFVPE